MYVVELFIYLKEFYSIEIFCRYFTSRKLWINYFLKLKTTFHILSKVSELRNKIPMEIPHKRILYTTSFTIFIVKKLNTKSEIRNHVQQIARRAVVNRYSSPSCNQWDMGSSLRNRAGNSEWSSTIFTLFRNFVNRLFKK